MAHVQIKADDAMIGKHRETACRERAEVDIYSNGEPNEEICTSKYK